MTGRSLQISEPATRARLRTLLQRTRNSDGGWPYYPNRQSRLEPTCWALLALGGADTAALLEGWQTASGVLIEPSIGSVNFAFNGLAALALADHGTPESARAAQTIARALLPHRGIAIKVTSPVQQDSTLQGWPWLENTFSWIEPTAWCTLAAKRLLRNNAAAADRIEEAERLFRDRACTGGGWNYGNKEVYGQRLRAHVPTTALGVLAMQDRTSEGVVQEAVGFLQRGVRSEESTTPLALSWIALMVVESRNDDLAAMLSDRIGYVEAMGSLASAAMMLYVLDQHEAQAQPMAFRV